MGVEERSRRRRRHNSAGFSLIEALVAAGVLGIALTALVQLHQTSMRGTVASSRLGEASEVARQLADHFSIRAVDTPINCAPNRNNPLVAMPTCAAIFATNAAGVCNSAQTCDTAPQNCTFDFDIYGNLTAPPAGPPLPGRYRVRLAESQNTSGDGFRVTVVVCWNDPNSNAIRSVVTDRLSVPGL